MTKTVAPGEAACRIACKISTTWASGQSWRTSIRRYASAAGSGSVKKSPACVAIRSMCDVELVDHFGKVEQHTLRVRGGVQHGPQQVPSAPSDIGDDAESLKS